MNRTTDELLQEVLRRLDRVEALLRARRSSRPPKKAAPQHRAPRLVEVDEISRARARQALRRQGLL